MPWGSSRGKKWHGKGWRDRSTGEMYINLKHSWDGAQFQREQAVHPNITITKLISQMKGEVGREDMVLGEGMHVEIFFRRKVLEESGERVGSVFQGGEVVYAKVFDEEGREMRNEALGGWVDKKRGDSTRPHGGAGGGAGDAFSEILREVEAERCKKRYAPY